MKIESKKPLLAVDWAGLVLGLKKQSEKIFLYGFYLLLFCFSYWLMFETFAFNEKGEILINAKVWSDFGATLPLIRSFSLGQNWPPEYPIFPGSAIQYHFVFHWLVAQLENVGFRIDWALNIPSILGFFLILLMTFKIASYLTNDKRVGLLSVVFFLLNGSLGFIQYFNKFGWTLASIVRIGSHREFSGMGPWDGGEVIGFWHLNVFINQRHLCFALGLFMAFIWTCLEFQKFSKRQQWLLTAFFAIVGGFMMQIHKPVFVMWGVTGLCMFVFMPAMRKHFMAMILMAIPCVMHVAAIGLSLTAIACIYSKTDEWLLFALITGLFAANVYAGTHFLNLLSNKSIIRTPLFRKKPAKLVAIQKDVSRPAMQNGKKAA